MNLTAASHVHTPTVAPAQSFRIGGSNALTWPFQHPGWPSSLVLLFLWWIPILGQMLTAGWTVEAIRLRGHAISNPLPVPSRTAVFLGNGLLLLLMYFLFYAVPLSLVTWLIGWSWLLPIWNTIVLLWHVLWRDAHENIAAYLLRNALTFFVDASLPLAYVLLISPLVLLGRIRYALTGKIGSFFCFFANTSFFVRHAGEVLLYFFLAMLARMALDLLAALVASVPLLGWLLGIGLVAAVVWARAFWASKLALLMQDEIAGKLNPTR